MIEGKIFEHVSGYQTPLYLYDQTVIKEKINNLKHILPDDSRLFYSMKANPGLGICQLIRNQGCGVEVASSGELFIAIKAGFKTENIIFTSPGKTQDELEYAISAGIKLINVDSFDEIKLINEIAGNNEVTMQIGIRINPSVTFSNAKIKMSGVSSQFGIEESDLDSQFFHEIKQLKNIELAGFQIYMGTQILRSEDIYFNSKYILKLVLELADKYDINLKYINFGGGIGVPYFKNEEELDLEQLKLQLQGLFDSYKDRLHGIETIFESGRYIMAEAGYFMTKVLYVKQSKGMKYVICDGGSSFHSSAAFLGRFVRNNFPMYIFPDSEEKEECTITGPLCTPLDIIGQNVDMKKDVKPGDFVIVEKSGAYGLTYSTMCFLSHEKPMELLYSDGEIKVLSARGVKEDYAVNQYGIGEEDDRV